MTPTAPVRMPHNPHHIVESTMPAPKSIGARIAAAMNAMAITHGGKSFVPNLMPREVGMPPRYFGQSEACERLRRKNKLCRLGIGADRR